MAYPQFPQGFLFGAATSAFQIEGGWNEDGKGPSIWDTFAHTPGKIVSGDTSDVACNTYHDFQTDINIMSELGLNAYRFSVSWLRVLPEGKGRINPKGLDYYNRLVDALLEKNIVPFVTLFHWDLPQALMDECSGFVGRDCAGYFADYAAVVVKSLGDRVKNWITINEPWEHTCEGYFLGVTPPGRQNPWQYFRAAHHILLGHGMAVDRIRAISPDARVGITLSLTPIFPKTDSAQDRQAAHVADQFFNDFYLDSVLRGKYPDPLWNRIWPFRPRVEPSDMQIISRPLDFLGVNFYSREFARYVWYIPFLQAWVDGSLTAEKETVVNGTQYTASGREVYPPALYDLLLRLKDEYGNPLMYITENGAAFTDRVENGQVHDPLRVAYLEGYMEQAARAIRDGVNLKGYFVWSLMDNFEWAEGFAKRFGLVYVDHATQQRIVKDSGIWYRDLIRNQDGHTNTNRLRVAPFNEV
jgi:beta-glucosidase